MSRHVDHQPPGRRFAPGATTCLPVSSVQTPYERCVWEGAPASRRQAPLPRSGLVQDSLCEASHNAFAAVRTTGCATLSAMLTPSVCRLKRPLGDSVALRAAAGERGYLYFRSAARRGQCAGCAAAVRGVRRGLLQEIERQGRLAPDTRWEDALARPGASLTAFDDKAVYRAHDGGVRVRRLRSPHALGQRWPAAGPPGAAYIASQVVGAVLASFALSLLLPAHRGLMGAHVPAIPAAPSVAMEVILTFLLMFVILVVIGFLNAAAGADRINRQPSSGLAVGSGGGAGDLVRRPHQRRLHDPGALPGPGPVRGRAAAVPVDLRHRPGRRRPPRRPHRPPHPPHQPIRNLTTGNSSVLDELPSHSTRPGRLQAQLAETPHRESRRSHSAIGQPGGVRLAAEVVARIAGSLGHEPVPLCRQHSTVPGTLWFSLRSAKAAAPLRLVPAWAWSQNTLANSRKARPLLTANRTPIHRGDHRLPWMMVLCSELHDPRHVVRYRLFSPTEKRRKARRSNLFLYSLKGVLARLRSDPCRSCASCPDHVLHPSVAEELETNVLVATPAPNRAEITVVGNDDIRPARERIRAHELPEVSFGSGPEGDLVEHGVVLQGCDPIPIFLFRLVSLVPPTLQFAKELSPWISVPNWWERLCGSPFITGSARFQDH